MYNSSIINMRCSFHSRSYVVAFPPLIRCSLRSRLVGAVNCWSFPPKVEEKSDSHHCEPLMRDYSWLCPHKKSAFTTLSFRRSLLPQTLLSCARKGQSVKNSSISMVLGRWRDSNRIVKINETTWRKVLVYRKCSAEAGHFHFHINHIFLAARARYFHINHISHKNVCPIKNCLPIERQFFCIDRQEFYLPMRAWMAADSFS